MHRRAPLACLLAGLVLSLGCAQCASPWDYCGPVYAGGPCNSCVVDDRMGSAFTGGPGMDGPIDGEMGDVYYEGEMPIEGEEAPYDRPYTERGEPMPTPADEEPLPAEDEPPLATPPSTRTPSTTPSIEPPSFEEAAPPDTLSPPADSNAVPPLEAPPLEAPPSEGRRTSFTAPIQAKVAGAKSEGLKAKVANEPAPPTAKPADAPAAANAPAKAKGWQAAGSKGRFRR